MKTASLVRSWKTTAVGWVAGALLIITSLSGAAGVPVPQINAQGEVVLDAQGDPVLVDPPPFDLDRLLMGLALLGVGTFARDSDKSSQDVGIRRT